jgi:hypothetical protein
MSKQKFDVFEYEFNGSRSHFSSGVAREFGENKIVFVDGHQILVCVQPLQGSGGLTLVGYLYDEALLPPQQKKGES